LTHHRRYKISATGIYWPRAWILVSLLFFFLFSNSQLNAAGKVKSSLTAFTFGSNDKMRVGLFGNSVLVQLQPRQGDGIYRFASWTMQDWKNNYRRIKKFNRNRPLQRHKYVTFPFKYLNGSIQGLALQALFSNDTSEVNGWGHRVVFPGETVSLIAGLYTRQDITAKMLVKYNNLPQEGRQLGVGDTVEIPWEWVREELNLRPLSVRPPLVRLKMPGTRTFAGYSIKKGESLYSAVVVRFTGRTLAKEVNEMAAELMELNKIPDATRIRIGTQLKIPMEWISEEYLVQNTLVPEPDAVEEAEKKKKETAKMPKKKRLPVHIILDTGHGGRDPGAVFGSLKKGDRVLEDELVYDIGRRLSKSLSSSRFIVHATVSDPNQLNPVNKLEAKKDDDEVVLVHPQYQMKSAKISINMRVFLVNDIYENLVNKKKIPKENIILMSIHGDALHPSLRGTTVYYPDSRLRRAEFKIRRKVYRRRREYRKVIRFRYRNNLLSGKMSAGFGKTIISVFKSNKLPVHHSSPVRGYYYRAGKRTLPAILNYSRIPTSVLVEVANVHNLQDRRSVLDPKYRQRIADALAMSITSHFGET
jgi:N-acetylmuramoyl-L-alanine amidase